MGEKLSDAGISVSLVPGSLKKEISTVSEDAETGEVTKIKKVTKLGQITINGEKVNLPESKPISYITGDFQTCEFISS